jgi:predicted dehydrogenase
MTLATIVTSNPERADRARLAHPEARVVDRVDVIWDAARDHDLVIVAAPNRAHVPVAMAALDAGLDVVLDKPMAPTSQGARQLVTLARDRGRMLTVFHNRRWDGDMLTVQRLLHEGAVGEVTRLDSRFERWQPHPRPDSWRMKGDPIEAGGVLFDLGSHLVDQAMVLFGRPTWIYAEVQRRRAMVEADDDAFIALLHPGGIRVHLWASAVAAQQGPRFRLLGMRGAYVKNGLDGQEDALRSGARPDQAGWGREPPERWGRLVGDGGERQVETEPGAYPRFYQAVAEALRSGGPPPVDPLDGAEVIEVLEAARRSADTSSVIELVAAR